MALSFKEGDILYFTNVSYTDHPKYQLTLSTEKDLFFVINSDISNTVAINDDFKNCQVKLNKQPNHTFMAKEEFYIVCHQLAPIIRCDEIEKMIKEEKVKIKGKIDEETLAIVKETVLNYCRLTLTPFDILYVIESLGKIKY